MYVYSTYSLKAFKTVCLEERFREIKFYCSKFVHIITKVPNDGAGATALLTQCHRYTLNTRHHSTYTIYLTPCLTPCTIVRA